MPEDLMPLPPAGSKWNTAEIDADPRVSFLLALGRALHAAGHSSQGLEEMLELAAARLGVPGEFFTTPTSMFVAFGQGLGLRRRLKTGQRSTVWQERAVRARALRRGMAVGATSACR